MVHFILTLHNHQPVGNFGFVFEMAYNQAYKPMLDVLYSHPEFKVTLHYSGPLLEWCAQNRPQFFQKLAEMIQRGQVEIMGGGFYEPILPILPHKDKVGQIEKMNRFLKSEFGVEAKGFWLAERVWEPHLVKVLADCGLEYVVVDDSHFVEAGIPLEQQHGYYISEEEGCTIKIFPGSTKLRYLIPFHPVHETIQYIQNVQDQGEGLLAQMSDDGEKFGIWPGTHKTVYDEGWMERFLCSLAENNRWIRTTTYTEYMQEKKPLGTIYLPCASYPEMMEWVLFTPRRLLYEELMNKVSDNQALEQYKGFFKGGFWRNFLVKYPESNTMHKKMLWVSRKLHKIDNRENPSWNTAFDELMRGQCNCAYWHGLFGGLYLPHLRHAIFHHLINAESEIDRITHHNANWVEAEDGDYLANGDRVILLRNPFMTMAINCSKGGGNFEWDYKPKGINFLNNFSRTSEAYHKKILDSSCINSDTGGEVKTIHEVDFPVTEELKDLLEYDSYRRVSFLDHFWDDKADEILSGNQTEVGDFVNGSYEPVIKKKGNNIDLQLKRNGEVKNQEIVLVKTIRLCGDSAEWGLSYDIENIGRDPLDVWFCCEINLNPNYQDPKRVSLKAGANSYNIFKKGHFLSSKECSLSILDLERKLSYATSRPADWRWYPIRTVSHSESQFEKNYQGTAFFLCWKLDVPAGESWDVSIKGDITPLK